MGFLLFGFFYYFFYDNLYLDYFLTCINCFYEGENFELYFAAHSALAVKFYDNAETEKEYIFKENKNKSGVYRFINKKNGKIYVGSSVDLERRFRKYFNISFLKRENKSRINNALMLHGYENFRVEILEYCEPSDCIKKEQIYLDLLKPPGRRRRPGETAGSLLGFKHTDEVLKKMSKARQGKSHPMFGKTHLAKTLAKMSAVKIGKTISNDTRAKISAALFGKNNPMYGNKGKNHPRFGKTHTEETRAKLSAAMKGENNPMFGKRKAEGSGSPAESQKISVLDKTNNQTIYYDSISGAALALGISKSVIFKFFSNNQQKPYKGNFSKGEKHPMYGRVSALIGRTHSEETKSKISANKTGVKLSEETKSKISAKKIGFKHSEETKEKLRMNAALNPSKFVHSKETLEKISKALSGENHPLFGTTPSEEIKLKISQKLSSPIEVTDIETNTKIIYNTSREAAKSFSCCISTINRNIRTQKLYLNRYKIIRVSDIKSFSTSTKSIELCGSGVRSNIKDIYSKLGGGESPELNTASSLKGVLRINLVILLYPRAALSMVKAILLKVYLIGAYFIGPSLARYWTSIHELESDNWILAKGHFNRGVMYILNLGKGLPKDSVKGIINPSIYLYYFLFPYLLIIVVLSNLFTVRPITLTNRQMTHYPLFLSGGVINKLGRAYYSTRASFFPVKIYINADQEKLQILNDNKGKAGIYR
jgi:group I intron endonuclease